MDYRHLVQGSLLAVAAFVACNVYDSSLLTGGDGGGTQTGGQAGSPASGGSSGSGGSPSGGLGGSSGSGQMGGTNGNGGSVSPEGGAGGEDTPTGGATTGGSDAGGAAGAGGSGGSAGAATGGAAGAAGGGASGAGAGGAGNGGMAGGGAGGSAGVSGGGGGAGGGGPIVVELTGTATADSEQTNPVHPAAHGNDGMTATRWCAANGSTGHYWTVDLGSVHALSRFEVMWEYPNQAMGLSYGYLVSVSGDGTTFTPSIDRRTTTDVLQTQTSDFPPSTSGRYVRITVTTLPASMPQPTWASFWEARVFGQ